MFERFTDRARRVVVLAQEEARLLNHNYIGTEHILLGLIHEHEGIAAKTLEQLGISADAVRAKVEAIIGEGEGAPSGHIPFTPRAKKVLELSLREALQLGHNYIGTEHILLGLIREGEGVGAHVLTNLGADLSVVRQEVVQQLGGYKKGIHQPVGFGMSMRTTRETPAAVRAAVEARRLAGGAPVASHHYLLGLLQQHDSMAAKALDALGVSAETLQRRLAELDPVGTSDETPEEAGARRIGMRVEGRLVMLEIDDPELAESLERAMTGRKVRIIKGTDPEAEGAGFTNLWSSVSRTIDDVTRRLKVTVPRMGTQGPPVLWRPPAIAEMSQAAAYWVVNHREAPQGFLEVGPGTGRDQVRAWLVDWLETLRPTLVEPGPSLGGSAALWLALDADGDTFTIREYGFGAGPPDSVAAPPATLVDAAIADLSASA